MTQYDRKKRCVAALLALTMLVMTACGGAGGGQTAPASDAPEKQAADAGDTEGQAADAVAGQSEGSAAQDAEQPDVAAAIPLQMIDDNYRTYYEVFVYSFCDSDEDGIGDLQGLLSRLDYINDGDDTTDTDLGCNGIWLMPIHPSPTYHKYDVTDYYGIDPAYGTMEDFQELLAACDERGIKVIMDLVLNHTSSGHPWFVEACEYLCELGTAEPDPSECPYVDYYHFSKEPGDGYCQVEGCNWYYEARFWEGMPDLNLDCEALREEIAKITQYWLAMGVGGFRLDAVKEYYSDSAPDSIAFLTWLTDTVKSQKEDAYLVGEAWLNLNAYAQYYESGIDSLFDFHFAGAEGVIAKVLNGSSAGRYGEAVASLDGIFGQYNEDYIDAPFYTNHDMARSAGYYTGENADCRVKMAGAMNLFMSGSAFVYYGEELGMKGSGKDENKRAPMYWSKDESAEGMCDGPADMEDFEMKYDSLAEQEQDASSIYSYYKKAIKIRNQNPEIARGTVEYLEQVSGESVCVLKKTYDGSELLLLFATGAQPQSVDLSGVELNGHAVDDTTQIRGMLLTGEEQARVDGAAVTMPAYSVLALK